ncbi:MAG: LD-carboxypeptidase [Muribaculaceae bacterium]|nr:LD-carboxypeptidase [Muribaculaceae bacterium]
MIFPNSLKRGDRIAILSPSSPVKEEYIDRASEFLVSEGFEPVVMPFAKGPASGSYASTAEQRLDDFISAWEDDSIRAILCSRGGYGAVHLLRSLPAEFLRQDPKWLIGYSDISALHAMLLKAGVASIHSPMAKHLSEEDAQDFCVRSLIRILKGNFPLEYEVPSHPYNIDGEAEGILAGGNLAVLNGLFGTAYDILQEGVILFIEDISEAIYAVERMLYHILLSGGFDRIKGLIIGRFTEYRPDKNFSSMEDMIKAFLEKEGIKGIPVAFNFPVGHVKENYPLVEGATAKLTVTSDVVKLSMSNPMTL